jgi:alpha-tubulin suppressor-like RCC1 family protein
VVATLAVTAWVPVTPTAAAGCLASTLTMGDGYSAAIRSDGTLLAWGRNYEGQVGIGARGGVVVDPTPVITSTGLTKPTGVWAGYFTTFATDAAGQAWGWGDNTFGQLGNPDGWRGPAKISGPTNVVSFGAGFEHTVAATTDGSLWGWGDDSFGELGFPTTAPPWSKPPTRVSNPANVVKVSAGSSFSIALTSTGSVYAAGLNDLAQTGRDPTLFPQVNTFQAIPGLPQIMDIAAGSAFAAALDSNGHVWAWGQNAYGQMGNGTLSTTTPQVTPGLVTNLTGTPLNGITAIAAGGGHVLALDRNGAVWAWGANNGGQLGNGNTFNRLFPVQVNFPSGVTPVAIAAGGDQSLAADSTGKLWAWGYNADRSLGTGGFATPAQMSPAMLSGVSSVSTPCGPPAPKTYKPTINGYSFENPGTPNAPSYLRMASFYPASAGQMFFNVPPPLPPVPAPTAIGLAFYAGLFRPFYVGYPGGVGGLCYGMAASNSFLYNHFPDSQVATLYPKLSSDFPGTLGASPSPADKTIEEFIDRYHSRQLAASGAQASVLSWGVTLTTGGNKAALTAIAADLAGGKTEWLGLGPNPALSASKFLDLFQKSHALLAYAVDLAQNRISVYDPSHPMQDDVYIQVTPSGGIELHGSFGIWYGNGTDAGQPNDWVLMPLPDAAFSDKGIIPGADNNHWVLDTNLPLLWLVAASTGKVPSNPIFVMRAAGTSPPLTPERLPAGSAYSATITATAPGSQMSEISGAHLAQVTQTDAAAAGSSHSATLSADVSHLSLSAASAVEQFTVRLGADFLPTYGRQFTLSGITLAPRGSIDTSADAGYGQLTLSSTGMADQRVPLQLEQLGQGAGTASVSALLPGGASGQVTVFDWNSLSNTLIFETIIQGDRVSGLTLQGNPAQQAQLQARLVQTIQQGISSLSNAGLQTSLQAKLDNAADKMQEGKNKTASNVLNALRNEIAAQTGKGIPQATAASMTAATTQLIGLLRASPARSPEPGIDPD